MFNQLRRRSPEASFQGMPVSCTLVPGAWLMMSSFAVDEMRKTGRGPSGRDAAQILQARASAES